MEVGQSVTPDSQFLYTGTTWAVGKALCLGCYFPQFCLFAYVLRHHCTQELMVLSVEFSVWFASYHYYVDSHDSLERDSFNTLDLPFFPLIQFTKRGGYHPPMNLKRTPQDKCIWYHSRTMAPLFHTY